MIHTLASLRKVYRCGEVPIWSILELSLRMRNMFTKRSYFLGKVESFEIFSSDVDNIRCSNMSYNYVNFYRFIEIFFF